ncbi:MAG: hypothetical protein ABSH32_33085 [Bryobacteraceae bacterium]|jgi:hypothetical protein
MPDQGLRILIKAKLPKDASFRLSATGSQLQPLLPASAPGGDDAQWHIADAPSAENVSDLWDLCHRLQKQGMGVAGGPDVEFAEPDLLQEWVYERPAAVEDQEFGATSIEPCQAPNPPDRRYPVT